MEVYIDNKITWEDIIEIEPRLKELYQIAKNEDRPDLPANYCANEIFHKQLKPKITRLAGWGARNPELRSCRAYDVAYHKIVDALPACQHDRPFC